MDFRYYVYKMNSQFNALIFLKILLVLSLLVFIFFVAVSYDNSATSFILNIKNSLSIRGNFEIFNFNLFFVPNLIIIIFLILIFILWVWIMFLSISINGNAKRASNYAVSISNKLVLSFFLDILFTGFIIILFYRKEMFIKVYNAGIDVWFDLKNQDF